MIGGGLVVPHTLSIITFCLGVATPPHPQVFNIWNFWSYVSPIMGEQAPPHPLYCYLFSSSIQNDPKPFLNNLRVPSNLAYGIYFDGGKTWFLNLFDWHPEGTLKQVYEFI